MPTKRCSNSCAMAYSAWGPRSVLAKSLRITGREPDHTGRGTPIGRMALERRVVHIEDALTDPEFADFGIAATSASSRTMLAVPLFREDRHRRSLSLPLAGRAVYRKADRISHDLCRPGGDRDRECPAVQRIARPDRRTGALGRRTEDAERGRTGGQLDPRSRAVLSTILTRSVGLAGAEAGAIFRYSRAERAFRLVEAVGWDEATLRSVRELAIPETDRDGRGDRPPCSIADRGSAERAPNPLRDLASPTAIAPY